MTPGLNTDDPTLVAAFRSVLLHQTLIVLAIAAVLALGYGFLRARRGAASSPSPAGGAAAEPAARAILRYSFGALWILDGILQAQPQMAGGLPSVVVQPAAAASPRWVQDVVSAGGTIWSFHPVQAAAATVWIQAGLGLWLLVARSGWWSRLGGLASVGWGLVVWVFGESFGGIFAPGLSWLNGAPGAVLLYIAAGSLIALPLRAWNGQRLGRLLLAGTGAFWIGMAVLQAWPGRGFWQGYGGSLTSMVDSMAGLQQPHAQAAVVNAFARFTSTYGFWVNLVAVAALAGLGAAFCWGSPRVLRIAVPAAVAFCIAVWVLVQDLGMPGGLGTDPNSMLPWVALLVSGHHAVLNANRYAQHPEGSVSRLRLSAGWAAPRSLASLGALGIVLVGVVPMGAVSLNRHADPIIARALAGDAIPVNRAAPDFHLTSQAGQPVSLASLRGKVTLLTFLDPQCTASCPVTSELVAARGMLGPAAGRVELVAIAANPVRYRLADVRALDKRESMNGAPGWLFLTGPLTQLREVWGEYGIVVAHMAPGSSVMTGMVFVIDGDGQIRQEIRDNPGAGTVSTRSSFAVVLSEAARQTLSS
jgi:cytochrome oxidase Cu insertion factor (SCO1/SenC/PrrC family)